MKLISEALLTFVKTEDLRRSTSTPKNSGHAIKWTCNYIEKGIVTVVKCYKRTSSLPALPSGLHLQF